MRVLFAALLVLATLGLTSDAFAQDECMGNDCATVILHAVDTAFSPCAPVPITCVDPDTATVDVTGFTSPAIYVMLRNYEIAGGLQVAFQPDASWAFTFGDWTCQAGQLSATTPAPPWGPMSGTITTAFNAIFTGELLVIGRLHFGSAGSGCLDIVESSFPFANHIIDDAGGTTPIADGNEGRVCVGPGGIGKCEPVVPVEDATWGGIKAQYR